MRLIGNLLVILTAVAALSSCNPAVSTSLLSSHTQVKAAHEIEVLPLGSEMPTRAIKIGSVDVYDGGFTTNCSYDVVIHYAQQAAAESGADILHITDYRPPNFFSTCHQIAADFYKLDADQRAPVMLGDSTQSDDYHVSNWQEKAAEPQAASPPVKDHLVRVALSGGFAQRLARLPDVDSFFEEYLRDLRSGTFLSAELGFNLNPTMSLGMRFDRMRSSNSAFVTLIPENPSEPEISGAMRDDVKITFIGPQIYWRSVSKNQKTEFLWGFAVGYMGFRNDAEFVGEEITLTGSTLGLRSDLAVDFRISPSIAIGLQLGLATGGISRIEEKTSSGTRTIEFEAGEGESLLRLDIGGGIRFML